LNGTEKHSWRSFDLSKYNLLGGLFVISGFLMVLFQAISSMMTAGEIVWKKVGLMDVIDA
jgi:hypothetical protein